MERLKKLEQVQKMLMFMESNNFISQTPKSSDSDSHRFLAQFIIFLMEPCGKLTVEEKCSLISQHLPKMSPSFLEKALVVLPGEHKGILSDSLSVNLIKENNEGGSHRLGTSTVKEDVASIGFDSMQRANSTLEDFCRSYFMFHGMDVKRPESIFKYLPVLSFAESYIYQLDTLNEKMVNVIVNKVTVQDGRSDDEAYSALACTFDSVFESDPFCPLTLLLQHNGLLSERIREELKYGEEYWALERKLCGASEQVELLKFFNCCHIYTFYKEQTQQRKMHISDAFCSYLSWSLFLNLSSLNSYMQPFKKMRESADLLKHILQTKTCLPMN